METTASQSGTGRPVSDNPNPYSALPITDLTAMAKSGRCQSSHFNSQLLNQLSRGLYRSSRHVLIVSDAGVGKTTLLMDLAYLAAAGWHQHLENKRFLKVDCRHISSDDAGAFLGGLAGAARREPNTVWCLDDLGVLLSASPSIAGPLATLLRHTQSGVIATLTREEHVELLSRNAPLAQRFEKIELHEPNEEQTLQIVQEQAECLAARFRLRISTELVNRAVALTSNFLLSECQPAKTIRVLEQICEDVEFNRTQLGENISEIQITDVIEAIADKTGIPAETISGENHESDFAGALRAAVVGQEQAIVEVSKELGAIKAGLNEPGKPASVMLFAGMTGVGKTELAKRIAELYSSSHRIQTYTMANFTEPHSVSGIIGVPPGYVGFEHGGRLINELNADPYSVFLLDEAEKAHPNVWKPFLNLFDEGWIVDQRGVKAYADRAIFILTTNAGDRNISQMSRAGQPVEAIVENVKAALSKVRHERSTQPVFPPAFLSRIGRVVVFQPLDENAMVGIAERVCARIERQWQQKRNKKLTFPREMIEWIGRKGHAINERAGGREGGRIIHKLVADQIESRVHAAMVEDADRFRNVDEVQLIWNDGPPALVGVEDSPKWSISVAHAI